MEVERNIQQSPTWEVLGLVWLGCSTLLDDSYMLSSFLKPPAPLSLSSRSTFILLNYQQSVEKFHMHPLQKHQGFCLSLAAHC